MHHPIPRRIVAAALATTCAGLAGCGGGGSDGDSPPQGSTPAPEPTPASSFESVVAAVRERVEVYDGIATGVIALVRVGDRTKVVTGGLADVADERPTAPGQTFPIASITKPMTATLVMQLVEEGRVALDDPARTWLPELRPVDATITVEQLLSHSSGLSETVEADVKRVGFDTAALLRRSASRPLDFPPGTRGTYSNIGYGALGLLVERVREQPLAAVLEERVFQPAAMASSSLGGRPEVQGYDTDGKPVENYYLQFIPAAGSVVSPAADVDAFFRALWAGELVAPGTVTDMRDPRGPVALSQFWRPDYGLGLIHWKVSCGTAVGHSGRIDGFTDEAWTLSGEERSAVVTVNDAAADDIARSIVETALCS